MQWNIDLYKLESTFLIVHLRNEKVQELREFQACVF